MKPQQKLDPTLAVLPTANLLREYHKLEQEIERRKKVLQNYRQNNLQSSNNEVQQPEQPSNNQYKVQRPPPPIKMPTLEFPQPYQSDSELAKLYQPAPKTGVRK
ncbi:mediator of RNA polymerase II transcription subunit 15-like [Helicoverpa armigera]|uniref:mediator of RNA polymerase II transcription subunit 15-like n=1 Tax=Helicoverpa armigera TaxID=29058 RepID=UPI0030838CDB